MNSTVSLAGRIMSSSPVCSMMRLATFGAVACAMSSTPSPTAVPGVTTPAPRGLDASLESSSIEANEIPGLGGVPPPPPLPRTPNYDPDVALTTPQLVALHGYPSESHVVGTGDGYLLTLHRIPGGRGHRGPSGGAAARPVVFLQHGLLASSADWVLTGPGKSLAYILADSGYDVWMGNARGNTYSRAHVSLSTKDSAFWNFSWHEIGHYDLPAAIDHVLQVTGQASLFYIGHSMGTTTFYVMLSTRPEYNSKVVAGVLLAPVVYLGSCRSPIRYLAPYADNYQYLAHLFGADEFLPQNAALQFFAKYGCELAMFELKLCENSIFVICGFDKDQFNSSLLPAVLSHTPAGTSSKTVTHFAQSILTGKFKPFGATPETPEYDLSKVTVPTAAFYADNDLLSDPTDVEQLFQKVPMKLGKFRVALPSFNHLDFLWGKSAKKLVFDDVLAVLARFGPETIRNRSLAVFSYYRMLVQQSGRRLASALTPAVVSASASTASLRDQVGDEGVTDDYGEASSEAP